MNTLLNLLSYWFSSRLIMQDQPLNPLVNFPLELTAKILSYLSDIDRRYALVNHHTYQSIQELLNLRLNQQPITTFLTWSTLHYPELTVASQLISIESCQAALRLFEQIIDELSLQEADQALQRTEQALFEFNPLPLSIDLHQVLRLFEQLVRAQQQHLTHLQQHQQADNPAVVALASQLAKQALPEFHQLQANQPPIAPTNRLIIEKKINQNLNSEYLFLSEESLTLLPARLFQAISLQPYWAQLQQLWLGTNHLTSIPHEIGQCANLWVLNLNDNQLTSIPHEIGQCANLRVLNLSHNHLTSVPDSIGQCKSLIYLNLKHNQLTSIPNTIGQCINLEHLYLEHNQLALIPNTIGQCISLESLTINYNQLTNIPDTLGQCTKLYLLYLDHNYLTSVPDTIRQCTNLNQTNLLKNQSFSLRQQLLSSIPAVLFTYKRKLPQIFNQFKPNQRPLL